MIYRQYYSLVADVKTPFQETAVCVRKEHFDALVEGTFYLSPFGMQIRLKGDEELGVLFKVLR